VRVRISRRGIAEGLGYGVVAADHGKTGKPPTAEKTTPMMVSEGRALKR
jgi:hypothetical protein